MFTNPLLLAPPHAHIIRVNNKTPTQTGTQTPTQTPTHPLPRHPHSLKYIPNNVFHNYIPDSSSLLTCVPLRVLLIDRAFGFRMMQQVGHHPTPVVSVGSLACKYQSSLVSVHSNTSSFLYYFTKLAIIIKQHF